MASLHSQFWKCELNTRQYTNIPVPLQTVDAQGSAKPIQCWNCTRVLGKVRDAVAHTGITFKMFIPRTWKKKLSGKSCKGTFPHQNLLPVFCLFWGFWGFFCWFRFFLYWANLALVQDKFRFGHADCTPSHFAMYLGCPGEDKRGFLRGFTKTARKMNCWRSPLPTSAGEAQRRLHPRGAITHTTFPPLLQASAGGKGASPTSPVVKAQTQREQKNTHNSKDWADKWVKGKEAREWLIATLPITKLELLDMEAGAQATWKSSKPYPFEVLQLCEGVGREPPLQRFQ